MESPWRHFSMEELSCPCCGRMDMDPSFMRELDMLRIACGFPFPVSSGFRCPAHNAAVSSTGADGPHTTGRAVDISISGPDAARLVAAALSSGFAGIGIRQHGDWSKRFVHLDRCIRPNQIIWTY